MDGVLNVNKPGGITSHDVVDGVRRILSIRRVGHAGSLDPMATGVLLVCVGQATRIAEYLMSGEKEYEGEMTLGVTTDTEDSSGAVTAEADASAVTAEQVVGILPRFTGRIQQAPPMVSAAHHDGRRLYELAREGRSVARKARDVEVTQLGMLEFEPGERPRARLRVVCSKGVYIRTLFAAIGSALGVGAHMSRLTRTRIGKFVLENSSDLDNLALVAEQGKVADVMIPMADALSDLPRFDATQDVAEAVRHGRSLPAPSAFESGTDSPIRIMDGGELLALARITDLHGRLSLQPTKVFV